MFVRQDPNLRPHSDLLEEYSFRIFALATNSEQPPCDFCPWSYRTGLGPVPRSSLRSSPFNDGCVTFGHSHGPVAIHLSAIEDWAEPEFGPD